MGSVKWAGPKSSFFESCLGSFFDVCFFKGIICSKTYLFGKRIWVWGVFFLLVSGSETLWFFTFKFWILLRLRHPLSSVRLPQFCPEKIVDKNIYHSVTKVQYHGREKVVELNARIYNIVDWLIICFFFSLSHTGCILMMELNPKESFQPFQHHARTSMVLLNVT